MSPLQEDWVRTPAGLYHSSCVHEIPSGARLEANRVVRLATGATYQIPTCAYKPILSRPPQGTGITPKGTTPAQSPTLSGWVESTSAYSDAGTSFRQISATWWVPTHPTGAYTSGKTFFTFPGLENGTFIIQPVLQYGSNGRFGGSYWTFASWHCDDGSNNGANCLYSSPFAVADGEALAGNITASNCAAGMCDWSIASISQTTGAQSVYTVADNDSYTYAVGGAAEVYNLTSCSDFPGGAIFYRNIALFNQSTQVSPTWSNNPPDNPDPSCNFRVTSTTTEANLYWSPPPPFGVSLSGKQNIARYESAQYTATPIGGTAPYTYQWRSRMGLNQYSFGPWQSWYGTGSQNYTYVSVSSCGIGTVELEVLATDANSSTADATYYIYITNPC